MNLGAVDWKSASLPSEDYNCVGFAVGDNRWWQPSNVPGLGNNDWYYWPEDAPADDGSVDTYVEALGTVQFELCENGDWEDGIEKIVLLFDDEGFTHAAVLVAPGIWKSKFGELSDFTHSLDELSNGCYGDGRVFLKRLRSTR
jgi:hypothetical protein